MEAGRHGKIGHHALKFVLTRPLELELENDHALIQLPYMEEPNVPLMIRRLKIAMAISLVVIESYSN